MNYPEYLALRAAMVEENANLVGTVLNEQEQRVNRTLAALKAEIYDSMDGDRLFKMNLLSNEALWQSKLYDFIRAVPKGSDLHVHATALLPAWKLIDFVHGQPDLSVDPTDGHIYHKEEPARTPGSRPLAELLANGSITREDLHRKWTLLGRAHNENVWSYFENLLCLFESVEYSLDILKEYYIYTFEDYLKNNIFHIEIHALFSEDYETSVRLAQTVRSAYYEVKKRDPRLIVSVICAGLKYSGVEEWVPRLYLENALRLREEVLDEFDADAVSPFVLGFDLLNEEDKSVPLKDLAPMLLACREEHPDFQLYLHCGESLNAQSDNLIDGYLLGAARVGHGMNLYRYPKLLQKYAEREICLEACPISNQTLRYVRDLRLHPGAEYLKRGVTVALCSDDPVCQEHESLCDDFFAAVLCWDLDLADVKQLCINAILYSGLNQGQKSQLIGHWKKAWQAFLARYDSQA